MLKFGPSTLRTLSIRTAHYHRPTVVINNRVKVIQASENHRAALHSSPPTHTDVSDVVASSLLGCTLGISCLMYWEVMRGMGGFQAYHESLQVEVQRIRRDIQEMKSNLRDKMINFETEMKDEMKHFKTEMKEMTDEMKEMTGEMNSLKTEMNSFKTEMKSELKDIKGELREIKEILAKLVPKA